jgi:acetyl-CoA carboxylase alpha subunit
MTLVRDFGFSPAGALRHLDWLDAVVDELVHGVGGNPTGIFERLQSAMRAELRRLDLIKVANAALRQGWRR